jgi:hypothetical protein
MHPQKGLPALVYVDMHSHNHKILQLFNSTPPQFVN